MSEVFVSTDARRACRRGVIGKHDGRVSQRYRFESRRGEWALFSLIPSALSFIFLWHTHTRTHTPSNSVVLISFSNHTHQGFRDQNDKDTTLI